MNKELSDLIDRVCSYLEVMPYYKWAAKSIGKSEDWLSDRRKEYPEIAERCEVARSAGIAKFGKRANPEFILTHADPKTFNIAKKLDIESGGKPLLPITIIPDASKNVQGNNSNKEDIKSD